ncbi:MAG: hypothetical protein R2778_12360 [Saprospiraceae bacterium]
MWTTSNGNIVSGEDTANPLIDQPGTYQLEITNTVNGCTVNRPGNRHSKHQPAPGLH